MLLGLDQSDNVNKSIDIISVIGRLLQLGEVLHQVHSQWVIKISDSIVVKFSGVLDISEHQTMCYIWTNGKNIPIAEPLGFISIGDCNYMFMTYVEGETLAKHWPLLSPELKSSIQSQLGDILRSLRQIPSPSMYFGSGSPPLCKDLRRHIRTSSGALQQKRSLTNFWFLLIEN